MILAWTGFGVFVLAMLALDLGVFHRRSHEISLKEALGWTASWVTLALLFNLGLWHLAGPVKALEFLTGYLIEYSLSADNVFVFALIFAYFGIPSRWQHRVLFWGVLGALVLRLGMIVLGAALIRQFQWVLYIFGAFLILTGLKMVFSKPAPPDLERNWVVRWVRRLLPVTTEYQGERFMVRSAGRWVATPLLLVLACVELSDLVFALDSIPAIFGVTLDPFIVYTSNVFAILGLRSLYFVLARAIHLFRYLKTGLGLVLGFIGVKMLLAHTPYNIETLWALAVVGVILALSIAASLVLAAPPAPVSASAAKPAHPKP